MQRIYLEKLKGPLFRAVRTTPELKGVKTSEETETEDNLDSEESIEDTDIAETVERDIESHSEEQEDDC